MSSTKETYKISSINLVLVSALFLTLPFERIPTFEFAGFTIKLSYIIGCILLLAVLFGKSLSMVKKIKLSTSDKLLSLFWLISLLGSLITSPDIERSIIILALWTFVFLLYFVLSRILVNEQLREKIFKIIILSASLVSLFGIFQFVADSLNFSTSISGLRPEYTKAILGFPRIQSVAMEPLYFANFLLMPFFISIVKYVQNKQIFRLYFWISVLILTNIILTISRGAYIAVAVSLIFFIIFLFLNRYKDNYMNKLIGIIIIILLSLSISYLMVKKFNGEKAVGNFTQHSVVDNVQADGSAFDRIGTYKLAYSNFKSDPVLGTGTASFGILIKNSDGKTGFSIVNNEYLEILSENGLIGFLLFTGFIIVLLIECWRAYKKTDFQNSLMFVGLALGILAILIQYNFFSTLYIIYIWAFLALLKSFCFYEKA